jgi:very-short-patch-repair endonuclease
LWRGANSAVELCCRIGGKPQPRSPDHVIAAIAERQYGLVTRSQLLEIGFGRHAITSRVRLGRLHALHRGVYLVGHPTPTRRALELGAVLAAGAGAVLSHASAAYFWTLLPYPAQPHDVHVTLSECKRHQRPGIVVHSTTLPRSEYCVRDGIPVTGVPRTLLDLASCAPRHELAEAVNEAHAQRRVGPAQLERIVACHPGRAGTRALVEVAGLDGAGPRATRSRSERRLLREVLASDLPPPQTNVIVGGYEVDMVWRDAGLVVEVDAWPTHGSRPAFERDRRRDATLVAHGLTAIRVTAELIDADPGEAVRRIRSAYAALKPRRRAGSA